MVAALRANGNGFEWPDLMGLGLLSVCSSSEVSEGLQLSSDSLSVICMSASEQAITERRSFEYVERVRVRWCVLLLLYVGQSDLQ